MIPAKPRGQTIKRVLLIASVLTLLFIGLYLSLFTTAAMPQDSRETATRALVLKHYRAKFLKPGDWVSAELPDYSGSNVLRRLGWIQQPDLSNIPRSRRKTTGNRMARKILEMDYKPTYFISTSGADTNQLIPLPEYRIRGKAVYFF